MPILTVFFNKIKTYIFRLFRPNAGLTHQDYPTKRHKKVNPGSVTASEPKHEIPLRRLATQFANEYSVTQLAEMTRIRPDKLKDWLDQQGTLTDPQNKRLGLLQSPFPFKPRVKNFSSDFTFIDLFAGIGGLRIPFQQSGGDCVFSSEWNSAAKRTYFANFSEYPSGDITQIASEAIPEHDLLVAGFPCQPFSQAGLKQGFSDTRGTLFFEIQRIISHHKPAVVLLENVKQLKGHDQGRTLKTITSVLEGNTVEVGMTDPKQSTQPSDVKYHVASKVLNARDFGVPQNRERIFILALRSDLFSFFDAEAIFSRIETKKKKQKHLGSVLQSINEITDRYTISDKLWNGHQRRLKEHQRKGNGFGYSLFTAESPYCSTISARYYKDGSEILIDQSELGKNPRKITPREAARIQGFPEKFRISACSDAEIYKQFGNSVAVPVIKALADEITPLLKAVISARTERIAS